MIDIKHPSYKLNINTANCQIETWVNDILVFEEKSKDTAEEGSGIGVYIPLNPTILKNGKHKFELKILPPYKSTELYNRTEVMVKILIDDTDKIYYSKHKREGLKEIVLVETRTPWGGLDKGINYPSYELKGEFKATMLPFKLEGWSKSVNLAKAKKKKLFKEVFTYYRQLHAILKRRDAVKWEQLHQEKEALIAKAFYYDYHVNKKKDPMYTKMVQDRSNAIAKLFKEKGLELVPLDPANLKLLIQAEGQLVSLVRRDNTPALRFNDPKNEGQVEMEVRLQRKEQNGGLSII